MQLSTLNDVCSVTVLLILILVYCMYTYIPQEMDMCVYCLPIIFYNDIKYAVGMGSTVPFHLCSERKIGSMFMFLTWLRSAKFICQKNSKF